MPIENVDLHSLIPFRLFIVGLPTDSACFQAKMFCATAVVAEPAKDRSWHDLKKIIDKVHKHVCGHASLSDV